jgi:hypothetical protein
MLDQSISGIAGEILIVFLEVGFSGLIAVANCHSDVLIEVA